jgi:hypothetical protein
MKKQSILIFATAIFIMADGLTTLLALPLGAIEAGYASNILAAFMPMSLTVLLLKTVELAAVFGAYVLSNRYGYKGACSFKEIKQAVPMFSLTLWIVSFNVLVISVYCVVNNLIVLGELI